MDFWLWLWLAIMVALLVSWLLCRGSAPGPATSLGGELLGPSKRRD